MSGQVAVFIDPPSHHFLGDRLFDPSTARYGGDNILAPYIAIRDALQAKGIPVHTADRLKGHSARRNLFVSFGRLEGYPEVLRRRDVVLSAFFAMECPIVEPSLYRALPAVERVFKRLFTWTEGAALEPFTRTRVHSRRFWWPQSVDAVDPALWTRTDRGFLVMINANKLPRLYDRELYTARLRAVEFFHRYAEIDLYGKNWDKMPNRVGKTWVPATARRMQGWLWKRWQGIRSHPLYAAAAAANRGPVDSKLETLSRYAFAICFENMQLQGWMTEKLFDCLCAGTVPVYWGATDVEDWVEPSCYIDMRRFADFAELRRYLHSLGPGEIARFREAGRAFLASPRFDRFRWRALVDLFHEMVRSDSEADA